MGVVYKGVHNYPWFSRDRNYNRLRGAAECEEGRRQWDRYHREFA